MKMSDIISFIKPASLAVVLMIAFYLIFYQGSFYLYTIFSNASSQHVALYHALFVSFFVLLIVSFFFWKSRERVKTTGLLTTFLVSFFLEMYGFTLMFYVLSSLTGQSLGLTATSHMSYVQSIGVTIGNPLIFVGLLLLAAGWVNFFQFKDKVVNRGLYKYMRHPQYLGIILFMAGFAVQFPLVSGLLLLPIMIYLYIRLAKSEDKHLAEKFGREFEEYKAKTPMFGIRL